MGSLGVLAVGLDEQRKKADERSQAREEVILAVCKVKLTDCVAVATLLLMVITFLMDHNLIG